MTLTRLALRDLSRNAFRSWMVFLCAALVAGLALATALIERGAGESLRLTQRRLGADILVVPQGGQATVESALLVGTTAKEWLPIADVDRVRRVPGVAAASPQLYLATLKNASCCSVSSMFIVAFDPKTDFTVQPWLKENLGGRLKTGEAVGGTHVFTPEAQQNIRIYNYLLTLKGNLEPTGGNLDRSIFLTFETARAVARLSETHAEEPLAVPPDKVSSVLVKTAAGADVQEVANAIRRQVPGVSPVIAPKMFGSFRGQMAGLTSALVLVLGLTLGLSLMLVAVVFSMAAHERRREIGVLRALGATRGHVAAALVIQAAVLAAAGGAVGVAFAAAVVYLFHDLIVARAGFPFTFPPLLSLAELVAAGVLAALVAAVGASLVPAARSARQDPSFAMRE